MDALNLKNYVVAFATSSDWLASESHKERFENFLGMSPPVWLQVHLDRLLNTVKDEMLEVNAQEDCKYEQD